MESDVLERAEAAWQAGSDELQRIIKLPRQKPESVPGGLLVGDQAVQRADIDPPTEALSQMLGVLRESITAAKGASTELGLVESNLLAQLQAVAAQSLNVRTQREKYDARWGAGG